MKRSKPNPPSETEIQHAAYLLWLEAGRPEGRALEHWFTAKELLLHRRPRRARTTATGPAPAKPAVAA